MQHRSKSSRKDCDYLISALLPADLPRPPNLHIPPLTRKCVNWTATFSQRSCKCATSWACPATVCPRRLSKYSWRHHHHRRCCCYDSPAISLQLHRFRPLRCCLLMWGRCLHHCSMRSKLSNCHQTWPMKLPDCCRHCCRCPSMWPIVMPQLFRGSKRQIALKVATF